MQNIAIIGGGASGMAAALAALENPQNHVTIFERQSRLGKKLMATGNGRCNLSNTGPLAGRYHGDADFAAVALRRFSAGRCLEWFGSLGLLTVTEPSGRVYPVSDAAGSVLDVLRFALEARGAETLCSSELRYAAWTGRDFVLHAADGEYRADRLIIACGGAAGSRVGGGMDGYRLLAAFGHESTELHSALVQLKTDNTWTRSLKGVRCPAAVYLDSGGELLAESRGEVQFTDYGVSGPAIFDVSRAASLAPEGSELHLDLLPEQDLAEVQDYLHNKIAEYPNLKAENLLTGAVHNSLGRTLVRRAGIGGEARLWSLEPAQAENLAALVKDFVLPLQGTLGFDAAQVTAGGVKTEGFDPVTMESRYVPGLYACGEVLNVDGDCGGFNLQWAWASGRAAGLAAGGVY